jgi:hypothetical protein
MNVPGFPDTAISCAPGRLGPGGAAGVMIFDVGHGMLDRDPVARFFREDAGGLEWLRDFLCDPGMDRTVELLSAPEEDIEREPVEEAYSRADLCQAGGNTWDDM